MFKSFAASLLFTIMSYHSVFAQSDTTTFKMVKLRCLSRFVDIQVPAGGRLQLQHYMEGAFQYVFYRDSSRIILHCGHSMKMPMIDGDDYIIDKTNTKITKFGHTRRKNAYDSKVIRSGHIKNSSLLWREENFGYRNIAYFATPGKKIIFDSIIDSLWIKTESIVMRK